MLSQITLTLSRTAIWAALLATAAVITTSAAIAGECPADQRKADVRPPNSTPARDVTDNVIGTIDVAKEPAKIPDRLFRLRKLVIQPGGVVPWHSHGNRPAIIYILSGEIVEYASNCAVPIVHRAGDVALETAGVSHWWQNHGKVTVELLSADLQRDRNDNHM
jgi:quercetin dioxygenase-like cupin family protein